MYGGGHLLCLFQDLDNGWEGEGVRAGGHITEREGKLVLEGFVGDRLISANVAVVDNYLHIFMQV